MALERFSTVDALAKKVSDNSELQEMIRDNPASALQLLAKHPLRRDHWVYRLVVFFLGSVTLTAVAGAVYLAGKDSGGVTIPPILTAIGSAAVGAMAGLLAPRAGQEAGED